MGLFSSSEYDELNHLIEKATSEYIPAAQENLALNLEITDVIKSKRVDPKDSLRLLLSRLVHENPNVQLLTLQLLDKCVKNGGKHFLIEMAGREFVDVAVSLMDDDEDGQECNQMVQDRLIELFQEWALLFQSDPALVYLYDTYCTLKLHKRVIFPTPPASMDHLDPLSIVSTAAPPDWSDNSACMRCRDIFSFTNRKHHCRRCGGVFCQLCSSNSVAILEMGIIDPVRVCDKCYNQSQSSKMDSPNKSKSAAQFAPTPPNISRKNVEPDFEDADFKKAVELSLKESQPQYNVIPSSEDLMLKKAIEASLNDTQQQQSHVPVHTQPPKLPEYKNPFKTTQSISQSETESALNSVYNRDTFKLEFFNSIELENISIFHQLIMKLLKTRPVLSAADALELKALAEEMRKMARRPLENEKVKRELEEGLRGFDLLMEKEQQAMFIRGSSPDADTTKSTSSVRSDSNTDTTNANIHSSQYHQQQVQQSHLPSFKSIQAQLSSTQTQFPSAYPNNHTSMQPPRQEQEQQFSYHQQPVQNEMVRSRLGSLSLENTNHQLNEQQYFADQTSSSYQNPTHSHQFQGPDYTMMHPHPAHPVVMNSYSPPIPFQNPYAPNKMVNATDKERGTELEGSIQKKKKKKSKKSKRKREVKEEVDSEEESEEDGKKGKKEKKERGKRKRKSSSSDELLDLDDSKTQTKKESKLDSEKKKTKKKSEETEEKERKKMKKEKMKKKSLKKVREEEEEDTEETAEDADDVDENEKDFLLLTDTDTDILDDTTPTQTPVKKVETAKRSKSADKKKNKKEIINLIDL